MESTSRIAGTIAVEAAAGDNEAIQCQPSDVEEVLGSLIDAIELRSKANRDFFPISRNSTEETPVTNRVAVSSFKQSTIIENLDKFCSSSTPYLVASPEIRQSVMRVTDTDHKQDALEKTILQISLSEIDVDMNQRASPSPGAVSDPSCATSSSCSDEDWSNKGLPSSKADVNLASGIRSNRLAKRRNILHSSNKISSNIDHNVRNSRISRKIHVYEDEEERHSLTSIYGGKKIATPTKRSVHKPTESPEAFCEQSSTTVQRADLPPGVSSFPLCSLQTAFIHSPERNQEKSKSPSNSGSKTNPRLSFFDDDNELQHASASTVSSSYSVPKAEKETINTTKCVFDESSTDIEKMQQCHQNISTRSPSLLTQVELGRRSLDEMSSIEQNLARSYVGIEQQSRPQPQRLTTGRLIDELEDATFSFETDTDFQEERVLSSNETGASKVDVKEETENLPLKIRHDFSKVEVSRNDITNTKSEQIDNNTFNDEDVKGRITTMINPGESEHTSIEQIEFLTITCDNDHEESNVSLPCAGDSPNLPLPKIYSSKNLHDDEFRDESALTIDVSSVPLEQINDSRITLDIVPLEGKTSMKTFVGEDYAQLKQLSTPIDRELQKSVQLTNEITGSNLPVNQRMCPTLSLDEDVNDKASMMNSFRCNADILATQLEISNFPIDKNLTTADPSRHETFGVTDDASGQVETATNSRCKDEEQSSMQDSESSVFTFDKRFDSWEKQKCSMPDVEIDNKLVESREPNLVFATSNRGDNLDQFQEPVDYDKPVHRAFTSHDENGLSAFDSGTNRILVRKLPNELINLFGNDHPHVQNMKSRHDLETLPVEELLPSSEIMNQQDLKNNVIRTEDSLSSKLHLHNGRETTDNFRIIPSKIEVDTTESRTFNAMGTSSDDHILCPVVSDSSKADEFPNHQQHSCGHPPVDHATSSKAVADERRLLRTRNRITRCAHTGSFSDLKKRSGGDLILSDDRQRSETISSAREQPNCTDHDYVNETMSKESTRGKVRDLGKIERKSSRKRKSITLYSNESLVMPCSRPSKFFQTFACNSTWNPILQKVQNVDQFCEKFSSPLDSTTPVSSLETKPIASTTFTHNAANDLHCQSRKLNTKAGESIQNSINRSTLCVQKSAISKCNEISQETPEVSAGAGVVSSNDGCDSRNGSDSTTRVTRSRLKVKIVADRSSKDKNESINAPSMNNCLENQANFNETSRFKKEMQQIQANHLINTSETRQLSSLPLQQIKSSVNSNRHSDKELTQLTSDKYDNIATRKSPRCGMSNFPASSDTIVIASKQMLSGRTIERNSLTEKKKHLDKDMNGLSTIRKSSRRKVLDEGNIPTKFDRSRVKTKSNSFVIDDQRSNFERQVETGQWASDLSPLNVNQQGMESILPSKAQKTNRVFKSGWHVVGNPFPSSSKTGGYLVSFSVLLDRYDRMVTRGQCERVDFGPTLDTAKLAIEEKLQELIERGENRYSIDASVISDINDYKRSLRIFSSYEDQERLERAKEKADDEEAERRRLYVLRNYKKSELELEAEHILSRPIIIEQRCSLRRSDALSCPSKCPLCYGKEQVADLARPSHTLMPLYRKFDIDLAQNSDHDDQETTEGRSNRRTSKRAEVVCQKGKQSWMALKELQHTLAYVEQYYIDNKNIWGIELS